ncbi:MAG: hypothetical protein ACK4YP_06605 [Myxococcota bacterium]
MEPVDIGTKADEAALVRGLQDARLDSSGTVVGGYGQIQARWLGVGPDPRFEGEATVRRLVLFVSHDFSSLGAPIRAYTELEWENAIAGEGHPGSVEVEQAFLEARIAGDALSARAGLLLVPFGIVNQWHEPPVFHGVERPSLDLTLIPTTWRELGVGIVGKPGIVRYELYAMTPLDPTGFDDAGIVNGRTLGAVSPADALAVSGRVEVEPTLGLVAGVSGYGSDAGGAGDWFDATGERRKLSLPVIGAEADVRWRGYGFEARALGTMFWLPESDDLMEARRADGSPYFPEGSGVVPTHMRGGYVELGWNVLHPTDATMELVPFARLEHYDTQAAVPEGYDANPLRTVDEATFGLTFRPISNVAVKADVQLRDRKYGDDELQWDVGVGYMF